MRGRKGMVVCISLVILLIVAVGSGIWLSHTTDAPTPYTTMVKPSHSVSTQQHARGEQTSSSTLTRCVLNGNTVAGCNGTTMMNGQTCTIAQEMQKHQITFQCK